MSEYKVVMLVRSSNYDELMSELGDIDFEALGVKISRADDEDFDLLYGRDVANEG